MVTNSSKYRCDAVIVPSQGDLVLVPLPDITTAELESTRGICIAKVKIGVASIHEL